MLVEAILGAFVETGRDLLVPGVILLALAVWMVRDLRRSRTAKEPTP